MSAVLVRHPIKVECFWLGKDHKPDIFDGNVYVDAERKKIGFTRFVESEKKDWCWEVPLSDVSHMVALKESSAARTTVLDGGVLGEVPEKKGLVMVLFLEGEKDRIGVVEPGKDDAFKFPLSEIREFLSNIL